MRGQIGDLSGRETWHFDVASSVIWLNFSYNPRKCLLIFGKKASQSVNIWTHSLALGRKYATATPIELDNEEQHHTDSIRKVFRSNGPAKILHPRFVIDVGSMVFLGARVSLGESTDHVSRVAALQKFQLQLEINQHHKHLHNAIDSTIKRLRQGNYLCALCLHSSIPSPSISCRLLTIILRLSDPPIANRTSSTVYTPRSQLHCSATTCTKECKLFGSWCEVVCRD